MLVGRICGSKGSSSLEASSARNSSRNVPPRAALAFNLLPRRGDAEKSEADDERLHEQICTIDISEALRLLFHARNVDVGGFVAPLATIRARYRSHSMAGTSLQRAVLHARPRGTTFSKAAGNCALRVHGSIFIWYAQCALYHV
jgi:hypothetical protein